MHEAPIQTPDSFRTNVDPDRALRPADRVLEYLEARAANDRFSRRTRLPSLRVLARHLEVSVTTVQSVFRKLAEQGRVQSEVGNGSFLLPRLPDAGKEVLRIGVNIAAPKDKLPSVWTYRIYGGLLHGVLEGERSVVVRPFREEYGEDRAEEALAEAEGVDGFILFPFRFCNRLRSMLEAKGVPVVDLNPPGVNATVNFVSPDYFEASYRLGRAWRETGRRRIALVMSPGPEESVSVRLRCAGLFAGLGTALGKEMAVRVVSASSGSAAEGSHIITKLIKGGFRPDAVYCAGDDLAAGAIEALAANRLSIPSKVSVVGGNGVDVNRDSGRSLTAMQHPLSETGTALVELLLERIRSGGKSVPGNFLPVSFLAGGTTRREENALLAPEN